MSSLRALQTLRTVSRLSRTISTSSRVSTRLFVPSLAARTAAPSVLARTFSLSTRAFAAATEEKGIYAFLSLAVMSFSKADLAFPPTVFFEQRTLDQPTLAHS